MKYFSYIVFFVFCTKSFGQVFQNESYHYQFLNNYQFLNPAFANLQDKKAEVSTTYESFFGPQKIFKTIQVYGLTALSDDKIHVGGRLYSKIAENFSSLSVVDANFIYQLVKQKKWDLRAGMWMGAMNFLLQSNAFYAGSSEWNMDWRFGLFSKHEHLKYGVSLHHFVPVVFVPFEQEIKFAKELNVYGAYQIPLSIYSKIEPTLLYSIREDLPNHLYWGTNYSYDDTYKITCGFQGTTLMQAGVNAQIYSMNYGFSYHRYFNEIQQNGYQIQFSYFFSKKVFTK